MASLIGSRDDHLSVANRVFLKQGDSFATTLELAIATPVSSRLKPATVVIMLSDSSLPPSSSRRICWFRHPTRRGCGLHDRRQASVRCERREGVPHHQVGRPGGPPGLPGRSHLQRSGEVRGGEPQARVQSQEHRSLR